MTNINLNKSIIVITVIAISIVGFTAGFMVQKNFTEKATPTGETETKVDLPLDLLKNPLITRLYANTQGTVLAKDQDSITLQKDDSTISLKIKEGSGITTFTDLATNNTTSFENIKVGDYLMGGVSVTTRNITVGVPPIAEIGEIVAHHFDVIKK
ncbi:hypothetical protein HYT18_00450 [Candidatus Microgenomates bacterium]|nr:hypothetical protein [Candidatus Microgenomates bacterium]